MKMLYEKDETDLMNEAIYKDYTVNKIPTSILAEKYNMTEPQIRVLCRNTSMLEEALENAPADDLRRTRMSKQTEHCLARSGIRTLSELRDLSKQPHGLDNIRGLGKSRIEECMKILEYSGYGKIVDP